MGKQYLLLIYLYRYRFTFYDVKTYHSSLKSINYINGYKKYVNTIRYIRISKCQILCILERSSADTLQLTPGHIASYTANSQMIMCEARLSGVHRIIEKNTYNTMVYLQAVTMEGYTDFKSQH